MNKKNSNHVTSETVQKAYRRYARYYDLVFGLVFHPGRRTAIEHLHCHRGNRILEVGVGTGLSLGMYPEGVKVVGIDLSADTARSNVASARSVSTRAPSRTSALATYDSSIFSESVGRTSKYQGI